MRMVAAIAGSVFDDQVVTCRPEVWLRARRAKATPGELREFEEFEAEQSAPRQKRQAEREAKRAMVSKSVT